MYRSMKRAADGSPIVGAQSKELGVREPPGQNADVDVDGRNLVILNGRGMSVVANWRHLLPHLIPKRLRDLNLCTDASGSNSLCCWTMGSGSFAAGPINDSLGLGLKPGNLLAGNVVPASSIPLQEFQTHLAATREQWVIDEA